MSYTNQTQHYGLPQYVGTDVPAWLTDMNGAFATIDKGMNAAKTQADTAATTAGQAANDIVSINSTLGTQAAQISAAAQAAAAAQSTANTADSKADSNTGRITTLEAKTIDYTDIEITSGSYVLTESDLKGKIPIAVTMLTSSTDWVIGVIRHSMAGVYSVILYEATATIEYISTVTGTARVFLA